MTMRLSPQDWETISAYLDGQLSQRERGSLESRLNSSPELRQALDEMRRIRTLLRSQPRLRAPRNFTLTPDMVARPELRPGRGMASSPWNALFGLRLTGAFAAVLLVIVLVADLFSAAPPVATSMNGVLSAEQSAEQSMAQDAAVAESMSIETFELQAAMPAPSAKAPEEEMPAAPPPAATPQPTGDAQMYDSAAPASAAGEGEAEQSDTARSGFEAPAGGQDPQANPGLNLPAGLLRSVEIGLAGVALIAGLFVVLLRRTGRGE